MIFAVLYDVVMRAADRAGLSRRRSALASETHGRVLEIGAGTGLEFAHYAPGLQVFAIEPDLAMLARAADRRQSVAATVTLIAADAQALPFRDAVFDTALSALTFCTIPDPSRAVHELHRVLRPTGTAFLLEHVRARHRALAWTQVVLTPLWKRVAGGCHLARRTSDLFRASRFDVDIQRASLDGALVEFVARPTPANQQPTG